MGHLMGDQLAARPRRAVAIKDRRRQFQTAANTIGLNLGQFFVGVRANVVDEELQDRLRVSTEGAEAHLLLLWIDPGRQRNAVIFAEIFHPKRGHAERHQAGANGAGFLPHSAPQSIGQIGLLGHAAV